MTVSTPDLEETQLTKTLYVITHVKRGFEFDQPIQPWNPEQSEDQSFENNANKSLLESLTSSGINYMTKLIS